MGAISSAVTGLTSAVGAVKSVAQLIESPGSLNPLNTQAKEVQAQQSLALKQLQAQQQVQTENAQANAAIQQQELAAQEQSDADQRQSALKAAVSRQRAAYGAQGLSPDDGSSQAVLLGLYQQSDEDQADQDRVDNLRSSAIDQNLDNQSNINVLQRSQLIQQQQLQRAADGF